jgi:4-hydroxymandelate oxidase
MDRRQFAQWLAAGAVSGANVRLAAEAQAQTEEPPANPVTVADYRELARGKLSKPVFEYVDVGSADGVTLRENVAAFQRLRLLPPLLTGVGAADLRTTALGTEIDFPILLAPVAAQRLYHPEGAMASARAAAGMHTICGVSSSATNSIEEIAGAAGGPKWYQLYPPKDREVAKRLVQRAEQAGYRALVMTVDLGEWKDADRRNRFALPKEMLLKHLRDLGVPNVDENLPYDELVAFNTRVWDLAYDWSIFDWLRSITKLPILIKGVLRPEDAVKAVSIGLDGIIVSNHGGRRLDTVPASIDMLPQIADAVRGKCEVFLDSGIRRGTDVLKALAFGARAVLIGRPYAWALAADGENGVRNVLGFLRDELHLAMVSCGCRNVAEVRRSLVLPPR